MLLPFARRSRRCLKSEIDQRAQGESRRTRAITVEHLRRTRGKLGARSIRQARAADGRCRGVFARCAADGRCEPLGDACENTQRVRSRASLAARSVALPGAAAASPCVTAQRARCGSSRVLAHGVRAPRPSGPRIRPLERIVLMVQEKHVGAQSGTGSPARARVQRGRRSRTASFSRPY
jgi:hypothetical protein